MSRFFKSAAFPILIVVVLAFFAQKLIGSSSHTQKQSFGNLLTQLQAGQVKSLTLKEKDQTADVTLTDGRKYSVGYPEQYTP
jgi:cell division protease FtsH